MAQSHRITPRVPQTAAKTVRLGAAAAGYSTKEEGKFVKLAAESQYNLCAAGDPIEAVIAAVDTATSGGFNIGSVYHGGAMFVTADGLQATPGTGTIAIGDYVVTGTVVAVGTAQTAFPKVTKATLQQGATPATLAEAGTMIKQAMFAWRVVSLGSAGTGAVGTTIVVERVAYEA